MSNDNSIEEFLNSLEEPKDVVDYSSLSAPELALALYSVESELKSMKELMYPSSQEARDLHSQRSAILIELANRKLR